MRQLRVKTTLCSSKTFHLTCQYDYNFYNEEKNSFEPGWKNVTTIKYNSTISQSFQYKSSDQLDTYVYVPVIMEVAMVVVMFMNFEVAYLIFKII